MRNLYYCHPTITADHPKGIYGNEICVFFVSTKKEWIRRKKKKEGKKSMLQ